MRRQDRASLPLALPAILAVYIVTVRFHSLILRRFELIIIPNDIYKVLSLRMGVFKTETILTMFVLKTHLVATSLFHNIHSHRHLVSPQPVNPHRHFCI